MCGSVRNAFLSARAHFKTCTCTPFHCVVCERNTHNDVTRGSNVCFFMSIDILPGRSHSQTLLLDVDGTGLAGSSIEILSVTQWIPISFKEIWYFFLLAELTELWTMNELNEGQFMRYFAIFLSYQFFVKLSNVISADLPNLHLSCIYCNWSEHSVL